MSANKLMHIQHFVHQRAEAGLSPLLQVLPSTRHGHNYQQKQIKWPHP